MGVVGFLETGPQEWMSPGLGTYIYPVSSADISPYNLGNAKIVMRHRSKYCEAGDGKRAHQGAMQGRRKGTE